MRVVVELEVQIVLGEKISQELVDNSTDVSSWNKGSFDSIQDSLARHFDKHGAEAGATSAEQYMRKAEGFMQNLRGSKNIQLMEQ